MDCNKQQSWMHTNTLHTTTCAQPRRHPLAPAAAAVPLPAPLPPAAASCSTNQHERGEFKQLSRRGAQGRGPNSITLRFCRSAYFFFRACSAADDILDT